MAVKRKFTLVIVSLQNIYIANICTIGTFLLDRRAKRWSYALHTPNKGQTMGGGARIKLVKRNKELNYQIKFMPR